jgi:hypothetical protein
MFVTRKASEEIMHRGESNYFEMHNDKEYERIKSVVKWKIGGFNVFIITINYYVIAD